VQPEAVDYLVVDRASTATHEGQHIQLDTKDRQPSCKVTRERNAVLILSFAERCVEEAERSMMMARGRLLVLQWQHQA
jgi:hypothetical protein